MKKELSTFSLATLYAGAIMGSGFASGKEIYEFFARYGKVGVFGIALATVGFFAFGYMVMNTARIKATDSIEAVVCSTNSLALQKVVGYIITASLFIVFSAMIAAGSAAVQEEFGGFSKLGGLLIATCSAYAVSGGVESMSKSIGKIVPIMLFTVLAVGIFTSVSFSMQQTEVASLDFFTDNVVFSAVLYVSYNLTVALPALCVGGFMATKKSKIVASVLLASVCLGSGACAIFYMLLTNPTFSQSSPMPILLFANQISTMIRAICSFMLLLSIFCAASNCLLGVSKKLEGKFSLHKSSVIIAVLGYAISLIGFGNIIRYIYPIQGFFGLLTLALVFISHKKTAKQNKLRGCDTKSHLNQRLFKNKTSQIPMRTNSDNNAPKCTNDHIAWIVNKKI